MTPTEILTKRWDCIQEARLKEMQHITSEAIPQLTHSVVDYLNRDPFWEGIFDQLETQIRFHDPAHSYLPENHVQLD